MTDDQAALAQARAERLADLVEDTDLRKTILRLASEWRQSIWDGAARGPEPRSFLAGRDDTGEPQPPPPSSPWT